MRRLGKVLGIIGIVLLLLVVAVTTYGAWTVRRSFPQTSGEITLQGLTATVDVLRDDRGIPNIYADNTDDLFFAQGYVHAQDRFYEMDFRRHITSGRLSEMFGKSQVDTDKFLRISGWYRVAQQEYSLLSDQTKRILEDYTRGVNAYLADHSGAAVSFEYAVLGLQNPGYTIEPWTPVDSISWLKAMAWDLRGNMQAEIGRALASAAVGEKRTAQLYPPYPYDRHRPIVNQGAVVNGVFDQNATATSGPLPVVGSTVPRLPAAVRPALERTSTALGSLDSILGPWSSEIGSNSWVVSGAHTATGKPLLANDPHLAPMMPSIWYQMGLHCRVVSASCPYDMAGYTFSGVPGVIIGHNATIGWGFTNLGPDVTDLVLEKVSGDTYQVGSAQKPITTRQETIKVAGGDDVTITVRSTEHGPIVSDASDELTQVGQKAPTTGGAPARGDGYAVALRWTALTPGRTMDALTDIDLATNWDQFRKAASEFEVPAQNLIFASTDGTIGYQTPGRIPIRTGYDGTYPAEGWDPKQTWKGYIPFSALPSVTNPSDGWIVTANNAAIGTSYPYFLTDDWSYGARSQRITDLVSLATSGNAKITADTMRSIQFDTWNENAAFLVPRIKDAAVPDSVKPAMALFDSWDFTQPADSAPAAFFNAFWRHLLLDTFGDEVRTDDIDGGDRWFTVVRNLWDTPDDPWWDDVTTPGTKETRDDAVVRALTEADDELTSRLGSDPTSWKWGELHTLTVQNQTLGVSGIGPIERIFNRGPITTSGGGSIVNATGWNPPDGYQVDWVPSMRMVLDFSDLDRSTWVNLTGNSGHVYDRNYVDQLDAWQTGQTFPFPFSPAAVQAATRDTLTLKPA
ncbi:MAG: penicillin acylase family protein [Frankiales bacterium]|nr:penicillin acylase family protein [Frankiales bacterium]